MLHLRSISFAMAAVLVLLAGASPLHAQRRGPAGGGAFGPDARLLEAGVKAGLDMDQEAFVAGAFLRLPVDPWRRFALAPGAEVEFIRGNTEWQIDADGVFLFGRGGSLYVGGGPAFRSALYRDSEDEEPVRDLRTGYSLVVGLRTPPGRGRSASQVEFRWTEVEDYNPRVVSLGFSWARALPF